MGGEMSGRCPSGERAAACSAVEVDEAGRWCALRARAGRGRSGGGRSRSKAEATVAEADGAEEAQCGDGPIRP